jgi:hypothetical protein
MSGYPARHVSLVAPPPAAEDERALAEAEADVASGRVVSHDTVRRWLLSWGTPEELPPPECR